jgi:putative PIN family toxin of toxin-antitoxin system
MSAMRVVLDTNVLASGNVYLDSIPGRILRVWIEGAFELVLSHYIIDEMVRILPQMKKCALTKDEIRSLAEMYLLLATITEPFTDFIPELRDAKDQLVLGTFRAAQADYLITGDKDLLALNGKWPILTPAEFWAKHGG